MTKEEQKGIMRGKDFDKEFSKLSQIADKINNINWEKKFDAWFEKTMEDCAIYEFPENGIKGLMNGKTGKLTGFCFLKEYFKVFIVKDRKQVRHQTIKKAIEIVNERMRTHKKYPMTGIEGGNLCLDKRYNNAYGEALEDLKSKLKDLI